MHHRSRAPKVLGVGITAVLGLVLAAPPALAGPAADPDPVPGLVSGQDTAAPQLVTGLAEPAPGDPAAAALAHLAAHPDRYRIDPGQLAEIGAERTADGRRTVRFQQYHGGIPVLGAQYLVHLTGEGAEQRVESVGGKYFTGLTAPTTPAVPAGTLRNLALGSLTDRRARAGATAEDHGQVILPGGTGRLAQHFTLRGTDPDTGGPLVREVYLDATAGAIALAHDARTPYTAGDGTTAPTAAATARAEAGAEPATGTAPDAFGRSVKVNIGRLPDGSYQLTDLTRPASIATHDAAGRDYNDFRGGIPADSLPARSPGPDFPASTGSSGATDAHLNAAAVYDFYRDRLGRDGLDGKGGPITSVVNVTNGGAPFPNAFWDGKKMVYGDGGTTYHPFSVALDVAGHEMTHGVIEHTADLVYVGQPGAMNEALADYFGNAVEVTARGMSMSDPKAALLGESLCRTGTPEDCAQRRLDDRRTTVDDYLGAGGGVDNGGVHLNSTIIGGALWDIRRTLDPLTADRLVYRALADYLTPLDDFVDGRNAVLAAGRSLKLTRDQLRTVAAAFDAHGIRAGWENRLGLDSRTLLRDASTPVAPAAANGRWVMTNSDPAGKTPTALYTGSTTAPDAPTRISPEDGRLHGWAATDGRSAAWLAIGPDAQGAWGMEVLTRPLSGGPVRSLFRSSTQQPSDVQISGDDVAYKVTDFATGRSRLHLSHNGAPAVELPLPDGHDLSGVTLKDGVLGWSETWTVGEKRVSAPTVYSIAAGKVTAQYLVGDPSGSTGTEATSTVLAGGRLLWVETPGDRTKRSSIRSGALDGSGVTDVLSGTSPYAPSWTTITASDRAVTFAAPGSKPAGGWTNAALPKLWQLPLTGGTPERLSCNRGGQEKAAADQGTRVIWLDATAGRTDLVVRNRPAGSC
ncbi:M4 family metallopeptidase [Kitasatospora sp. NPDC088351]|uniref:M4 family metallopeptidase n=1 Tax=Kitasatospora sp. NPDC088351 TaxID=3155180 RepID=UPI003431F404